MRRRAAAALAVPFSAVMLAVSSCGSIPEDWKTPAFLQSGEEEVDERLPTVTGPVGEEPEVSFPDIAPPSEQISGVVHQGEGEGELVRSDDLLLADIVDYQWTAEGEAEKTQSTYDTGAPVLLQLSQMNEEMSADLVDQPLNSRVVYVFPPQDPAQAQQMGQPSPEPGSTVSIVDIQGRYGKGQTVPGEQTGNGGGDLPTVEDAGHAMPEITIPEDTDPPEDLETVPLVEGEGPEVEESQQLVVQYTGVTWSDGEVFDSTWVAGKDGTPFTFIAGAGQVIEGWDTGLVGHEVGSRVMLVIPEEMAYGEDAAASGAPSGTLVFVVDILGAVDSQPAPEEPASPPAEPEEE
ncbi:peptidylprolyl isomerase [Spinactinospora alkalitolerans]|uniref:peptidylprolyl isomerase n=1 Tax=Spinactinospora alkalitolerans TaxID=687207 RepID=A0A852TTG8_9ACTN|nr:FKBP-type peptidyl-prolyl cis-trans isomerase [Spinactinospora alkalitolerans]NYE46951.1 peptidylprolyl isomerase [Spinactinospora alkalitolerans]